MSAYSTDLERELREYLGSVYGELELSCAGMLRRGARLAHDRAAIMEPGRASLTFGALLKLAERTIGQLNKLGLTPESCVALALPSTPETGAVYRCVLGGMAGILLSPDLPVEEYERYLRHGEADAMLVAGATPGAREAAARVGIPVVEVRALAEGPAGAFELVGLGEPLAAQWAGPDDLAVLIHTSGTTALPKLVPRTQRQLALVSYFGHTQFNVLDEPHMNCGVLPLYLSSGFGPLMRSQAGLVAYSCTRGLDVAGIYRMLAHYRPPAILVVPSVLQAMAAEAQLHREEIAALRFDKITSVSAALGETLRRQAERLFDVRIAVLYGMTEQNTIATTAAGRYAAATPPHSVGRVMPFVEVKIADEDGAALPAGADGEIMLRSPLLMSGYWNNPAANAEAFLDGWFRTGDSGQLDDAGYLYLTGRVKEVINRGGSKVSPLDVDAALMEHPAVLAAATFAFPHSTLGEDVAAAVVLGEQPVSERELRAFAARRLPSNKVPSRFVFVDEIPRTALGKIRRAALTERFKGELQR